MGLFILLGWYVTRKPNVTKCPYTDLPLRRASELPFETKKRVYYFLEKFHEYDNRPFKFNRAAFCRETGRLFPDVIDWKGKMTISWNFLQKRHEGTWVAWGSLTDELKEQIRNRHIDLEGFQTARCSKEPSPRFIESRYVYEKPGPLYVDVDDGILMGWMLVPETELEVLVIQHPIR